MTVDSSLPFPDEDLPLRIGIVAPLDQDIEAVQTALDSAGWTTVVLNRAELASGKYESIDGVVICTGDIVTDDLRLVAQAALNPRLIVLVVGSDRDPQSIADILRSGASDYVPAPFAPEELVARFRALAMRSPPLAERRYDFPIVMDFPERTITAGPHQVTLSQREWDALIVLLEADSSLVTVEQLSERLTGTPDNATIVTSAISRLRRKLRASQFYVISVETVHGQGYAARFRRASDHYSAVEKRL